MNEIGYIYALINPINNEIFYIGKTKNKVEYRLRDHIYGGNLIGPTNKKKIAIINEIITNGYEVQIKVLKEIHSDNIDYDLKIAEEEEIYNHRKTIINKFKVSVIQ